MSKRSAEQSRAARAAEVVAQRRRTESRRRFTMIGGVLAVVVLLVAAGAYSLSSRDTTGAAARVPTGLTDGYGVVLGEDAAPTTLTFYEDPQCPICAAFEGEIGDEVADAVATGDVQVEYRVVSFLDHASENDYSSRAANALMVVQEAAGPEAFAEMHRILYENQPAEGTAGPEDGQLVAWAVEAGAAESEVREGIEFGEFDQYVENATDAMSRNGVNGTPTVLVDGEQVDGSAAESVAAVREAIG